MSIPKDAKEVAHLLGETYTDAIAVELKLRFQNVRVIRPNQVTTMEYRPGRLSVFLDEHFQITGFAVG